MDIMNIDIKSYYQFIKYTFMINNDDLPHEKMKLIILGSLKPLAKSEKQLKHFADAFLYLLNNLKSSFDQDMILKSYFILTNEVLDNEVIKNIYFEYCQNMDEQAHVKALKVHDCIIKNLQYKNVKFALMIANYIMLKNNRRIITIKPDFYEQYKFIFLKEESFEKRILFFIDNEGAMKRNYNISEKKLCIEEITKKLLQHENKIRDFGVKKLYIFGSVAKNTNYKSSDLDLLIISKDTMINLEKRIREIELQKFLEKHLEINVDIVDFKEAIFNFYPNELENIITIF